MWVAGDLLRLGDETLAARRFGEAASIYLRAYQAARARSAAGEEVIALSQLALAHLANGNTPLAGLWLDRAARAADPGLPRAWACFLRARARWERSRGAHALALCSLQEAFACALAADAFSEAADLALSLSVHAPSDRQLDWARTALATALHAAASKEAGSPICLAPFWENLAWAYSSAGRHLEALGAFHGARRAQALSDDARVRIRADLNVGRAYRLAGQPNTALGWLRETESWLLTLLAAAPDEVAAILLMAETRLELAECCLAAGRKAQALALLASSERLSASTPPEACGRASALQAKVAARLAGVVAAG